MTYFYVIMCHLSNNIEKKENVYAYKDTAFFRMFSFHEFGIQTCIICNTWRLSSSLLVVWVFFFPGSFFFCRQFLALVLCIWSYFSTDFLGNFFRKFRVFNHWKGMKTGVRQNDICSSYTVESKDLSSISGKQERPCRYRTRGHTPANKKKGINL